MKIVSYIRVSTQKQNASGLGLEAQQAAIASYVAAHGAVTVGAFVEVESGRKNSRPQLQAALECAQLTGARLVIAKLDRLGRNAAFLLNLQDAGVDFVACDNQAATPLTIGIMAVVAQEEARAISERTKAALAAAKARGTRLGNPNGAAALLRAARGNGAGVAAQRASADERAAKLAKTLQMIQAEGFTSLRALADELKRRGIKTARGGDWYATTVRNVMQRLAA
ncbi:recombinase family protein [Pseudomonas sp. GX19020]|uniref:recombinase family protein n=1 Tax=Pseudomonas sp. GX19020 TaxID=2942277 RepID=UPI00201973D0|nr:recombinase family protein [Pseudomonas sp. GX19020]MCL4069328.1 recombinase family protein [Pseudomonas sp. GX19020]